MNENAQNSIVVATFYKFVALNDLEALKTKLKDFMLAREIRGTIILAPEGINSTVSGLRESIDALLHLLKADPRFVDLEHKEAFYDRQVFKRTKVKLKKEIVTFDVPLISNFQPGKYVAPAEWNSLIQDPDVLLIDTRNDYEVELGTFKGALNPETGKFKDMHTFTSDFVKRVKPKKIAMFCTGGIRCEKYSAYMLQQGFDEVYHLQGGILKYLEEVPEEKSLWQGDCFVFDERSTVNHKTYSK